MLAVRCRFFGNGFRSVPGNAKTDQNHRDLIDELDRIREDLLAIQRGLEKMENVQTTVSPDARKKA
jgi:hypothetical protein